MSTEKETKGIKATIVLEIIGRPANHLVEILEKLIKEIGNEKGVSVIGKTISEPILMKDQQDFYTTFAEVEVETETILHLVLLVFKYMPSHIEIFSPELIVLTNHGWDEILNELVRRLHGYDEVARVLQIQNAQMQRRIKELSGEEIQTPKVSEPEEKPEKKKGKARRRSRSP